MINQIQALLGAFTYKPGWTFNLGTIPGSSHPDKGDLHVLDIDYPPFTLKGHSVGVCDHNRLVLPRYFAEVEMNASDILRWLHGEVVKFEIHISNECFRVDGVAPFAPEHT